MAPSGSLWTDPASGRILSLITSYVFVASFNIQVFAATMQGWVSRLSWFLEEKTA